LENKRKRGVVLGLEYELEVRDKHGKLISKTKGKSHSFVRNWIRMLRTLFTNTLTDAAVSVALPDTSGASTNYYAQASDAYMKVLGVNAPAGDDDWGIQVGTSDVAFDRTHYSLQGKISTGTGAGQLVYEAVTVEDYSETDSEAGFRVVRTFTNSSGADVTVKEIGIVTINSNAVTSYFLIARDVLATPQTIPDGAALTVRYRIYITY